MANRKELAFQAHIIDSYARCGGHAAKWIDQHAKGRLDLVCSLPNVGVHLVEVKHRPEFVGGKIHIPNAMTVKQRREARIYEEAGGLALAGVVCSSSDARGSKFGFFDPQKEEWNLDDIMLVDYVLGRKFDIVGAFNSEQVRKIQRRIHDASLDTTTET